MRLLRFAVLLIHLASVSGCANAGERPARPMFKGMELYSWQDTATREWRFVLVPGTNRRKTATEILGSGDVAHSADALERDLSRLAVGETVLWSVPATGEFGRPPARVVEAIVAHAASAGVGVQLAD